MVKGAVALKSAGFFSAKAQEVSRTRRMKILVFEHPSKTFSQYLKQNCGKNKLMSLMQNVNL
jgi:hypothetical protein